MTKLTPGVEVLYWNGVPIKRAIERNGENQAGSNPGALRAGLDNLTIRPLVTSLPPDEEWLDITYQTPAGEILTVKLEWLVYNSDEQPPPARTTKKKRAAIDIKKTKINQLKKKFFTPQEVSVHQRFEDNFYAEVRKIGGRDFGHIRLFSF